MLKLFKNLIFYVLLVLCATPSLSQAEEEISATKDTLLVGVAGSEPFVFDKNYNGIAIEIWKKIAEKNSLEFEFDFFENIDDALQSLNNGSLDLLVGPVSITAERLETMHFSQPFYNSSISIISRTESQTIWSKIRPLFSFQLLIAVLIFLMILAIVGTFLWLAERKASPEQFPKEPLKGIGTGMWLAIVTMTTTGYGDKAPITTIGRIITGAWMILSIIFATSMVAGIASTFSISTAGSKTISTVEQLSNAKTITISGSSSEAFLEKSKIDALGVNNLKEAIGQLKRNEVDAVVYDRPQLLYFLKNNTSENLRISSAEYYKQGYGFAFPLNSTLIPSVNITLMELNENREIERIVNYYIKKGE